MNIMSVEEYLRTLNGIFDNSELDPARIEMVGFIDVIPNINCRSASEVELSILTGNIIATRSFDTEQGEAWFKKTTPLNDDISIHCAQNGSPKLVIERTIEVLKELQEDELRLANQSHELDMQFTDYQSRINIFTNVLESLIQNNINSSSRTVR